MNNTELKQGTMLTTIDNPFNPKTHYLEWRQWDLDNHYNTEEYLARIADIPLNTELNNDPIINQRMEQAKQEILENDTLEIYKLI